MRRQIGLAAALGLAFALIVVPIVVFISTATYQDNRSHLVNRTEVYAKRSSRDAIAAMQALLEPVAATLRVAAELAAADPSFFRSDRCRDYMHQLLLALDQADSVYASSEDGYHRVLTRIDAARRKFDPRIPAEARWHFGWIAPYAPGQKIRRRHRILIAEWPKVVKAYEVEERNDVRATPQYSGAKRTGALFVADPAINQDAGMPVVAMSAPVMRGGRFAGAVSSGINLDRISRHLADRRFSAHSVTMILDDEGRVLAHPDPAQSVRRDGLEVVLARADQSRDPAVRRAAELRREKGGDRFIYTLDGAEYMATFTPFPESFGKKWQVLTVLPTDDFLGNLRHYHLRLQLLMGLAVVVGLVLSVLVARKFAAPIDALSRQMEGLRSLSFGVPSAEPSPVREIAELQRALSLLSASLKSFAGFVPIGVVRALIAGGKPLTRAVEPRFLTVLFCDLESFTSLSETTRADELSSILAGYFEEAAGAIRVEGGTLDKFIGDAVMAFWGAPGLVENQTERACCAALRIARRMEKLNEWAPAGQRKLSVRIGLHQGPALAGIIGSSDRLTYTAIGDAVNVAARLEKVNKAYGSTICMSEQVFVAVKDRVVARPIETVKVAGREEAVRVYELLGIKDSLDPELQPAYTPST